MDFLGIGGGELLLILILLFTVAGPKRMLQWAYHLGKYVAQFRRMFDETMNAVKKELDVEDLDIRKDLPLPTGRYDVVKEANKFINSEVGRPLGMTKGSANASTAAAAATVAKPAPDAAPTVPEPPTEQPSQPPADPAKGGAESDNSRYDAWLPN